MLNDTARDATKAGYWDSFYSGDTANLGFPSQFAAFVLQEADSTENLIEIGSGTGRDSFFFARHGLIITAIDGSLSAIDACSAKADAAGLSNIHFVHAVVGNEGFRQALANARNTKAGQTIFYARFFLHALTEAEEDAFFNDLAETMIAGDRLAVEYRTIRDASGSKVTESHYRRFVEPSEVHAKAWHAGLKVEYTVEGFGFAKYKTDDAYVARCIMRKS